MLKLQVEMLLTQEKLMWTNELVQCCGKEVFDIILERVKLAELNCKYLLKQLMFLIHHNLIYQCNLFKKKL